MTDTLLSEVTFASLDLPAPLMQGIEEAGFSRCTRIQAETLPVALRGEDVAGQAQTGTGKTAAFLIAAFQHMMTRPAPERGARKQPRAIVIAPTRELAIQIHKDAEVIGRHLGFDLALIYGGTGYDKQRQQLEEGVDVIIGTPGRIIDFFKQHLFDLKSIQVMVLDEADRMFDLGFIKDIRYLLRRMPPPEQRLSLLFSATLSLRVTELAYEHMNNPEIVRIEPERVTAERVREEVYYPSKEEKIGLLLGLLPTEPGAQALIFVNTKRAGEKVQAYLKGNGFNSGVLSGDVPQTKRQHLLAEFAAGEIPILVATDVAARGLHIPGVSHVFNFDLPQDAEDYVHRIGRTARAGASGEAISFACDEYAFSLMDIEAYIGHKIPVSEITEQKLVSPAPPVHAPRKRSGGRPGSKGSGGSEGRGRRSRGGRRRSPSGASH
ncbi:MAG: ATP-dependent RNA helicase RhlB [Gammaproteobacteria bacterium]|nr:ATP-dependent RNA helicase RhlB [Gammaproteobacteria bacterium]